MGGGSFGRQVACRVQRGKKKKITFPCCTSRGRRKGNSVVQNDTVLHLFFFTLHETAPFYEKRAISFKGGSSILFSN
jgi:hypothetical protein